MKVLGISGSPRKGHTTDRLVKEVLSTVDCKTEFISLAGLTIGPCIACLGCVADNVCKVRDDMQGLRQKIVDANAYVIGAANYYSMLNSLTHCFLERLYQFRHREGKAMAGKLGVAVGVGGGSGDPVIENIKTFFQYNQIECLGAVSAQGVASCFRCGFGETCTVGAIHMLFGPGRHITPDIIPDLSKQPDKIEEAHALGRRLSELGGDSLRSSPFLLSRESSGDSPPSDARPHSCFRKKAMGARPKLRNSLPPFSPHCFDLRSKAVGVRPRGLTPLEPPL